MVTMKKPIRRTKREYEITLKYIGKGKEPRYVETDYGFGDNPPVVIHAYSITEARNRMKKELPKTIQIRGIKFIPTIRKWRHPKRK